MLVRILTDEYNVHNQIEAIEKILRREVILNITLKNKDTRSNIEFDATMQEADLLYTRADFELFRKEGDEWLSLRNDSRK